MAMKSPTQARSQSGQLPQPKSPGRHSIDMEMELGIHPVRRPTDIESDVTELGQKKRVSSVLTSPLFKEELETVVTDLLRSGDGGGQVIAREIANMLSPLNRSQYNLGVGCVSPINDITGSDTSLYTKGEKLMRCKLAALYRLVDLNGWSQSIYNHITVRVAQEQEHFLINPFGLLYHEVSASKLIKVTMQGEIVDQGTTTFLLNKPGFILHSAIHSARPDLKCVIHVHTPDVVAVSMMDCGLMPISQEAMILGDVSYHSYQGLVLDPKEKKTLIKHLGPNNKVMFLRNHGLVACGETVEEAYHYLFHVMLACQTQVKAMACMKQEKLIHIDKSLKAKTHDAVVEKDDQMVTGDNDIKWDIGELMFEANMRMLDNMGYRTGFAFRNMITVHRKNRARSDVELPATAHGNTIMLDEIQDGRARLHSHPPAQSRWINSPNQYTKVQAIQEEGSAPGSGPASINGDVSPKTRTKWRHDDSSSHSTPIRIADANQFVPKNTDPREVAEKRKKIRGMWEENRPGPQSQKLDGVAPDEKRGHPQFFSDSYCSTAYDSVKPLDGDPEGDGVFTGSKGIIQKDYQHFTTVVSGPPNPFAKMSEEELKSYELEVKRKSSKKSSESEEVSEHELEQSREEITEVTQVTTEQTDSGTITVTTTTTETIVTEDTSVTPDPVVTEQEPIPPPAETKSQVQEVLTQDAVRIENKEEEVKEHPASPPVAKAEQPVIKATGADKKKGQTPQKVNGEDVIDAPPPKAATEPPKAKQDRKEPSKATPEGKEDAKAAKQKKSKKRRSLSFLKKNKEKKEKE